MSAKRRSIGLDILRLVAIILVLGRHMDTPPADWPDLVRAVWSACTRAGWVGVDLFFVLSGFLVSGLLFDEYRARGSLSLRRFYVRRAWKIYPPFYVFIATTVLYYSVRQIAFDPNKLLSECFFLQSYLPGLWNHTWSLAVEEHFYLILPLVLVVILRLNATATTPLRPVLAVSFGVAVLCLLLRVINWQCRDSFSNLTHMFATHLRIDALFFGVAISYAYHFHRDTFVRVVTPWRYHAIVAGVVLLSPAFFLAPEESPFIQTGGLTLFYIAGGLILVGTVTCHFPDHRLFLWAAAIGSYSYSIYLWHMPVLRWGLFVPDRVAGTPLDYGTRNCVYVVGSFLLGIAMSKLVEGPTLRIRDRWFPARAELRV